MKRALLFTATVLFVAVALVWFGGRCYLKRSVAQYEGTITTGTLGAPVEIRWDGKGIPAIHARTDADLYFALGWVHASERLFQMELTRRLAEGELAEIFGKPAFDTDVLQRKIGFGRLAARDAARLGPRERLLLDRYAAGVNFWVAHTPVLPPEFVLLRFRPRPWTAVDSLAIACYQTWFSHGLVDADRSTAALIRKLGPGTLQLLNSAPPWSPPTLAPAATSALFPRSGDLLMAEASNSWAVAPSRSSTGGAIHASDPHLAVDHAPGLWYIVSLRSDEGTDVTGVTNTGLPFVAMGHNQWISYAFTVSSVDIVDHYEETLSGTQVMTEHGPAPLGRIAEEIRVKGEARPRRIEVLITPRGPIVDQSGSRAISIHWAGFDVDLAEMMAAAGRLQHAHNYDEFRGAVTRLGALDANWVYADRAGHIGYQLGTPIPIREYEDTFSPHPASDPRYAWRGYRPLEETPHQLDPPRGWLASCNNRIVPDGWPYELPGFYDPWRIARISRLLSSGTRFGVHDFETYQLDDTSMLAARWRGLALQGAVAAGNRQAASILSRWNGKADPSSRAAALFELWWVEMARPLFEDELGAGWEEGRRVQEAVLERGVAGIIDDHRTPRRENAIDISARALRAAWIRAAGRTWGQTSRLEITHPLSQVKLLDWWLDLNRGPFPSSGDGSTLKSNFTRFDRGSATFPSRFGPSMRFVLDWAHPERFTINVPMGQSGNPFSPHYDDFLRLHRSGGRWRPGSGKVSVLVLR